MKQMERDKRKRKRQKKKNFRHSLVTKNWMLQSRAGTQYLLVTRTYEKATAFP